MFAIPAKLVANGTAVQGTADRLGGLLGEVEEGATLDLSKGDFLRSARKFGEGGWEGLDGTLLRLVTGQQQAAFGGTRSL